MNQNNPSYLPSFRFKASLSFKNNFYRAFYHTHLIRIDDT